jgi:hypothetical protein
MRDLPVRAPYKNIETSESADYRASPFKDLNNSKKI